MKETMDALIMSYTVYRTQRLEPKNRDKEFLKVSVIGWKIGIVSTKLSGSTYIETNVKLCICNCIFYYIHDKIIRT